MASPKVVGLTVLHPSESLGRLTVTHRWQRCTPGFSSSVARHWAQEVVFLTICLCYSNGILGPSASVLICINYPISDSESWGSVAYNHFCYGSDHCQDSTEEIQTALSFKTERRTFSFNSLEEVNEWPQEGVPGTERIWTIVSYLDIPSDTWTRIRKPLAYQLSPTSTMLADIWIAEKGLYVLWSYTSLLSNK